MNEKKIKILVHDKCEEALIYFSDNTPWKITIKYIDLIDLSAEGSDLFSVLQSIRKKLAKFNVKILCFGSRKDVYPSPMMRNMCGAGLAYKLTMGLQARRADIVNIFDYSDENIGTPEEQDEFYKHWLKSL